MSSNDLTQVRQYLRSRISSVTPDLVEFTDALEVETQNIPQTIIDTRYLINFGPSVTSEQQDRTINEEMNVNITVFKRGFNSPSQALDDLLQVANCIRLDVISPLNIQTWQDANNGNIEYISSLGLTPSAIDETNDNTILVTIGLTVALFLPVI